MSVPKISIIILNYNGKHYLEDCLSSVEKQSKNQSFECLFIDNGSTDDSVEFVRKNFPWVKIVESKTNLGFTGGNNLGARGAKGEFLVFLNYDTIVDKDWLSPLLEAFKQPLTAAAQSKVLFESERNRINTLGTDTHITGLTVCKHIFEADRGFVKNEDVSGFSGCSVMMPKNLFKKLGGFDEDFFLYLEDTDIGWRARLAGYKIVAVPASRVYHKYKLKMNPAIFRHNERNRLLMVLKNYSVKSLLLLFPSFFLMEVFTHAYALYLGPSFLISKLWADLDVFSKLGSVVEKRKSIDRMRKTGDKVILSSYPSDLPTYRAPGFANYLIWPFNIFFKLNRFLVLTLLS